MKKIDSFILGVESFSTSAILPLFLVVLVTICNITLFALIVKILDAPSVQTCINEQLNK